MMHLPFLSLLLLPPSPPPSYTVILTLDNGGKVSVVEEQVSLNLLFNPWSAGESLGQQSCMGQFT